MLGYQFPLQGLNIRLQKNSRFFFLQCLNFKVEKLHLPISRENLLEVKELAQVKS